MSNTLAKDPAPLHTTRQLLDELDALMERMLTVPVEDGAEGGRPNPDEMQSDGGDARRHPGEADSAETAATPAVSATLTMLEPPQAHETHAGAEEDAGSFDERQEFAAPSFDHGNPEDQDPDRRDFEQRDFETPPAYTHDFEPRPSYATASPLAELPAPTSVVEVIVPAPQPLVPLPARLRPSRSLGYQFLLWINRGYDHGTFLLGRRGRWLRNRAFRLGLGLVGGLLLAAATTWLIWDWFDWNR